MDWVLKIKRSVIHFQVIEHWSFKCDLLILFFPYSITGNNGGNRVPSWGSLLPLSLQRRGERWWLLLLFFISSTWLLLYSDDLEHLSFWVRPTGRLISVLCSVAVYEDEDELLWSPGTLPENKVRSFLSDVLSRTTDEKMGCDKPGTHVRDNEQVSLVQQYYSSTWPDFLFQW